MKVILKTSINHGMTRHDARVTLLGGALALTLAGCGSGSGSSSSSTGPITGSGAIIVNGVRYDDSGAKVSDNEGTDRKRLDHKGSEIKLGKVVSVTGAALTHSALAGDSATASAIVLGGELLGRIVGSPDPIQKTFVVLGQTVKVMASTVFDASLANGFSSLATDTLVEVHGVLNADTNTLQASFIEKRKNAGIFKIQGRTSSHDPIAKKFNIGEIRIDYSATPAADVRVDLVDGTLVRVQLTAVQPALPAPTDWAVARIRAPENARENSDEAEIEGNITAFRSPAQFSVNGIAVNAGSAEIKQGTAASLAVGVRVDVKGSLSSGVLIAKEVKIEDDSQVDNLEFALHGAASNVKATTRTLTSGGGWMSV